MKFFTRRLHSLVPTALAILVSTSATLSAQSPSAGVLQWVSRCSAAWPSRYAPPSPPPTGRAAAPLIPAKPLSGDVLFVGSSVSGQADPAWLFDVVRDQLIWSGSEVETNNITGAAYANGGRELFLAGGDANVAYLSRGDLTTLPPTWSVVYDPLGRGPFEVHSDDARQLLYVLAHPTPTAVSELLTIDNDPQSPTYLQVVASTQNLSSNPLIERFALSASGRRAAILSAFVRYLHIVDTDPTSPTYMQVLFEGAIPVNGPFPIVTSAVVTSDDQSVLISIQRGGGTASAIARFELSSMTWIDHNSGMSGIQHIGPNSSPVANLGPAAFDIDVASDDTFAVVCGWGGSGWAGRIDLDPAAIATWSWHAYAPTPGLTDAWALDLASGDRLVAIETQGQVLVLRAATGEAVRSFPVSLSSNIYLVRMK